jgi:signal transduction histidine kinase
MEEITRNLVEEKGHTHDDCRHAEALRDVKNAVRKISHDLSQPIMLLQGYLELLELEKFAFDKDSVNRFFDILKNQLDIFNILNEKLRAISVPVQK